MSFAPIALFVYNRADHFLQTYAALSACEGAAQSDLFIFSDGAKNAEGQAAVNDVRSAVENAIKNNAFKSVTVIKRPQNVGLAANIIEGVTDIINKYGTIIVLEDDCVASPYLLNYMNSCLEYYKNSNVGCIAGYTPAFGTEHYPDDVFLARRSCSCCWASFKEKWQGVDWSMGFMSRFYSDYSLVKRLNSNGNDRFLRLYRQSKRNSQSWSIRFGAHIILNDYTVVYPKFSYIQNIGCDSTGTHSTDCDSADMTVDLSKAIPNVKCKPLKIDENIQHDMYRFYSGGTFSAIKRNILTTFIWLKEKIKG